MKKSLLLSILVVAILMLGVVAYANADVYNVTKNPGSGTTGQTATDTVLVTTHVNPYLVVNFTTPNASQTVAFGNVVPGTSYGSDASHTVNINVSSNKLYNITITKSGDATIGLTTSLSNSTNNAKTASQAYNDVYSLNVPWTTDPGDYTATVTYTIVQN
jgi:hypothetical protein